MENAKAVIFVTETMKNDYLSKYEFLSDKSQVLYWGYNEEDFDKVACNKKENEKKVLVHAGNIFSYQNPKNFWKEIKKKNDSGDGIKIKFIGTVDPDIKKTISAEGHYTFC